MSEILSTHKTCMFEQASGTSSMWQSRSPRPPSSRKPDASASFWRGGRGAYELQSLRAAHAIPRPLAHPVVSGKTKLVLAASDFSIAEKRTDYTLP